jgi:hypothetical protein
LIRSGGKGAEGQERLSRFNAIIDAYGAEPGQWPEAERAEALALSRASIAAARALTQARALDAALRHGDSVDVELAPARFAQLHARIMAGAATMPKSWFGRMLGIDLEPAQLWPSVAGLAVATVLGIAVGLSGWIQLEGNNEQDDLVVSSIDAPAAQ